jgi:GTP-binding protein
MAAERLGVALALARRQGARSASSASLPRAEAAAPPPRRAFVDKIRLQVEGGRGGKGVVSFETSAGGDGWSKKPAGGTGGRGGDVLLRASASTRDLHLASFVVRGRAGSDAVGNKGSYGRDGRVKTILVPVGTVVREQKRVYIINAADLDVDGGEDELAVAYGMGRDRAGGSERGKGAGARGKDVGEDGTPAKGLVEIPAPPDFDRLRRRRAAGEGAAAGGPDESHAGDPAAAAAAAAAARIKRADGAAARVRVNKSGLAFRESTELLADLDAPGQAILVARGGAPGVGNRGSTLTYSEQRESETRPHITGGRGELRFLELELKTIADVGLVGFPNAGKSSFLAAVSKVSCLATFPVLRPSIGASVCV